jgi:hypothetical protein
VQRDAYRGFQSNCPKMLLVYFPICRMLFKVMGIEMGLRNKSGDDPKECNSDEELIIIIF